jgi:hypothetical protein
MAVSPQGPGEKTLIERLKSDFMRSIDFYGKVVDQHGFAVPDADVQAEANDKIGGGRPSQYKRRTDEAGLFSFVGLHGLTLGVEVSKPGYRGVLPSYGKVTSSGVFDYGLSSQKPYSSSQREPTIFILNKPGVSAPLVKNGEKSFPIAPDGSPLLVTLDSPAHQVRIRCWSNDLQRVEGQQKFDWRLEIEVPNGGLVARKDVLDFEAPTDGYFPKDVINMPASLPYGNDGWDSFAERAYFIKFGDGVFCRAKFEVHFGSERFVVWESFLNPHAGSRNLEAGIASDAPSQ